MPALCRSIARITFAACCLLLGSSWAPAGAQQKWAIVVGIDRYSRINQPLSAAVTDAKAMAKLLEEVLGFPRENIVLLTSEKGEGPLHTDITYEISMMSRNVKPGDTFVFFFAGHGMERGNTGYLLAWNSDPRAPETLEDSAVSVTRMVERLKAMPAQTKLLIFDACRTLPPGLGRSAGASKALPAGLARGLRTVVDRAPATATTALLFSCSVNQEAYEWPQAERGFFSYHVEKGLRGAAAGPDGKITLGSLIQYVQKAVPSHVKTAIGREQQPYVEPSSIGSSKLVLAAPVAPVVTRPQSDAGGQVAGTLQETRPDALSEGARRAIQLSNEAKRLYRRGEFGDAEASYREAIRLQPTEALYHNELGLVLFRRARYADAEVAYRQAIRLNPGEAEYHNNLGAVLYRQSKDGEAEAAYREATRLKPQVAAYHAHRGHALHRLRRYPEAADSYREAVRLEPGVGTYHADLAGTLLALGRREEAIRAAREAIELGEKNHWVFGELDLSP